MESKLKPSETMTPLAGLQKVPLITLMEHSQIPFAIKDKESRVQYINNACKKWLNLPKLFDFEGRRDDEFSHPIAAFAAEFQAQDRKAEKDKGAVKVIITSYFGRDCILEPYIIHPNSLYITVKEKLLSHYFIKGNLALYPSANSSTLSSHQ